MYLDKDKKLNICGKQHVTKHKTKSSEYSPNYKYRTDNNDIHYDHIELVYQRRKK